MPDNFGVQVEKIVNDYLDRIRLYLKGFPVQVQEELIKEIYSHIYESFKDDPKKDEIDRILNVLKRLGEPKDVISAKMPKTIVSIGKRKKLPFYVLAGKMLELFGAALGKSFILMTLIFLISPYYLMAGSLLVGGWVGMGANIVRIIDPAFYMQYIYQRAAIRVYPSFDPVTALVLSVLTAAVGFVMFWLGKYIFFKGIKSFVNLSIEQIKTSWRRTTPNYR
jgi:uncharacterized membrane protein